MLFVLSELVQLIFVLCQISLYSHYMDSLCSIVYKYQHTGAYSMLACSLARNLTIMFGIKVVSQLTVLIWARLVSQVSLCVLIEPKMISI